MRVVKTYALQERCEHCEDGKVDGDPVPTPQGPHYPTLTCRICNGDGWIVVEYEPITLADLEDFLS